MADVWRCSLQISDLILLRGFGRYQPPASLHTVRGRVHAPAHRRETQRRRRRRRRRCALVVAVGTTPGSGVVAARVGGWRGGRWRLRATVVAQSSRLNGVMVSHHRRGRKGAAVGAESGEVTAMAEQGLPQRVAAFVRLVRQLHLTVLWEGGGGQGTQVMEVSQRSTWRSKIYRDMNMKKHM